MTAKKQKQRLAPKGEFRITYFLRRDRKDQDGRFPVYIRSKQNNDGKHIYYHTGKRLKPSEWDTKKGRPKNKDPFLETETQLKKTYQNLVAQGHIPTLKDLIDHVDDRQGPDTNGPVIAWCQEYIENTKYSEGMRRAVATVKTNLEGWNKNITFGKLRKPQIQRFFDHLTEQGVANNTQYKRLRALINVAKHANITNPDLFNYELGVSTVNALKVRLNWQEVKAVMEAEAATKPEQIAKDVFLLACFSGLRISDILTIKRGELHEFHYERLQEKTGRPVYVTRHQYNSELLDKYIEAGIPYTRQALSRNLKEVLKRAKGFDKEITHKQKVGNNFKETAMRKYEAISFHSGRRFYARLLNDLGLGAEIARDELGHSFKSITDLYAGSPEHAVRVSRVRKAMGELEDKMKDLALMKVA